MDLEKKNNLKTFQKLKQTKNLVVTTTSYNIWYSNSKQHFTTVMQLEKKILMAQFGITSDYFSEDY